MMPQYRCTESYPFQRNQTPLTPYQAFPTPMPMDPAKLGTIYEPWPNGGNYGYPMPCHSCCNHGNFSGYYGFRPYVPAPIPSPVHFCGGYPTPYTEAYPAHFAPPPHYSVDLPRYEYDKNVQRSPNCCGCPHHFYNPKEEKSVKIEEQEPEVVEKKESDSLVPNQMKNYPQPVMWIPQEYLHNKGQRKSFEPEVGEHEKVQPESLKSCEQEPGIWNGWFPRDMNNLRSLMHGGDGKRTHGQKGKEHQQNKEQKRELPFPVIWMPSYDNKQEEVGKNDNGDMNGAKDQLSDEKNKQFPFPIIWMPPFEYKHEEEAGKKSNKDVNSKTKYEENPPSTFNIVPEKHPGDGNSTDNSGVNVENHAAQSGVEMKKIANQKIIPVKQIDAHEVDNSEETKKRGRGVPVNESSESNARRSSSPPKTTKLPPVCLRVDPLPRKKKGSSRSPSPPSSKSHPQENTNEKAEQDSKSHKSVSSCSKEVEPNEKEKKVIEVTERKISGNDDGDRMQPIADVCTVLDPEKSMEGGIECQIKEDQEASKVSNATAEEAEEASKATDTAKSLCEKGKLENKTLSDVEAAVAIQSAYRGFDVRRWEPLKKLKQIAEIREQLVDVRNRIQALDSSYDVQNDNKQKVVIGETIMSLLLKLDAIQGLPPSLRDIRKSMARELVNLQEKLDSLMIKTVERIDEKVQNRESMLKQEKQEAIEHGEKESSLRDVYERNHDTIEPCKTQLPHMIDSRHSSRDEEASVSLFENSIEHTVAGDDLQTLPTAFHGIKHTETNSGPSMEPKDEVVNGELEASPMMVTMTEKAEDASDPNQFVQVPLAAEDKIDSEIQGTNLEASNVTCTQTKDLDELPHGVIDNESVTIEFENDKQIEMDKNEVLQDSKGNEQLPLMTMEEEGKESHERKVEGGELEFMENEKMQDWEAGFETTKNDEVHVEHVEQEGESSLPASPTYSLVSADESGTDIKTNKKLEEENVKLKEMMEKLLEAGKEQLDVISNLTVRVKDLEKKLATTTRKKKPRTRKVRRSNIPPIKERVVGVAV